MGGFCAINDKSDTRRLHCNFSAHEAVDFMKGQVGIEGAWMLVLHYNISAHEAIDLMQGSRVQMPHVEACNSDASRQGMHCNISAHEGR